MTNMTPDQIDCLVTAMQLAHQAHKGQTRKGLDDPYIVHPMRVMFAAMDHGLSGDAVIAAMLHDAIEDSDLTFNDLRKAGIPERAVTLLHLLTKWWEGHATLPVMKRMYYNAILQDEEAVALKLLDRIDNLRDAVRVLEGPQADARRGWIADYLRKTRAEFPPLSEACTNVQIANELSAAVWQIDAMLNPVI